MLNILKNNPDKINEKGSSRGFLFYKEVIEIVAKILFSWFIISKKGYKMIVPVSQTNNVQKGYRIETKKGTVVSQEHADKVVKRNMILANGVGVPLVSFAVASIFSKSKKQLKGLAGMSVLMAPLMAWFGKQDFDYFYPKRDQYPQRFYKWGNYKIADNPGQMDKL